MFKNSIDEFLIINWELIETWLTQCISSCDLLKKHNENNPFLERLLTLMKINYVYTIISKGKTENIEKQYIIFTVFKLH